MRYSSTWMTMTPAAADVRATALSLFALLLAGMPVGASVAEERGDEAPEERTAEETPSLALLDYLGRWDEADAGWLELLAYERSGATADADNGDDDHE